MKGPHEAILKLSFSYAILVYVEKNDLISKSIKSFMEFSVSELIFGVQLIFRSAPICLLKMGF